MMAHTTRGGLVVMALALLPGCLGALDTLGNETVITEEVTSEDAPQDDRIEDKNPVYDPDLLVIENYYGCDVQLNKSASVARLDIVPFADEQETLRTRLFASRGPAVAEIDRDYTLHADAIPSMEVVNGKLKPLNDGMYAAVEQGLQDGAAGLAPGKRQWLLDMLAAIEVRLATANATQIAHLNDARAFLGAALVAGGNTVTLPAGVDATAQSLVDRFIAEPLASRPVGFYTWTPVLQEVFKQDRLLQNPDRIHQPAPLIDDFGAFAAMAVVLADEPQLTERYQQILALYAGLTNPYSRYTPVDLVPYVNGLASLDNVAAVQAQFEAENPLLSQCPPVHGYALIPPSRSKDSAFFESRWCNAELPAGTSFIDELISAIRSGELNLEPDPDSGWYDYQLWSLETLLLPERGVESDHLLLTAAYKKKLIDTFRSLITQFRETHIKQVGFPAAGEALSEVEIYPLFPVEPFPTFYLRTARAYRFVALYLEGVLGANFLAESARLREDGTTGTQNLYDELQDAISLTYGLYVLSARSVGVRPEAHLLADETAAIDLDAATERARQWLQAWSTDRDVLADPRVIVPVASNDGTGKGVYWAILGVKAVLVDSAYVDGFEPEVVEGPGFCDVTDIVEHQYVLLVEHMAEVRFAGPPPTRDEYRAICDQYDTADDIITALEARQ